jgi:hypothetical protein
MKPASGHSHIGLLLPQIALKESADFFFINNTSKAAYILSTVCWTITFRAANMELISDQNAGNGNMFEYNLYTLKYCSCILLYTEV